MQRILMMVPMLEHSGLMNSVARHPQHGHVRSLAAESRDVHALLELASLRPTRQRLAIAGLLFGEGHRHMTAGGLCWEAAAAGIRVSLATIYNTLNQLADAGLLRRIAVNGDQTYFDTDVGDHHHFYVEIEDRIIDIPEGAIEIGSLPALPDGYVVARIDVVIRLRRTGEAAGDVGAKGGIAPGPCAHPDAPPRSAE
ncbi:iron response transcriptional regulator IrrA [Bradyrhizobium sp. SK17]|uniref:iron response transcriptional regulator IrrA n=1 Tax=Bradyrhizobium sp. SK17 TaxID=2057741 RepID=UPI001FE06044|nr:Fur family transcriptional regulator [Bradyrhizobium sp. SK17]